LLPATAAQQAGWVKALLAALEPLGLLLTGLGAGLLLWAVRRDHGVAPA